MRALSPGGDLMPATPAGQMRWRIGFERATETRGALGTKTAVSWASVGKARAKVLYGPGSERREAGIERSALAATFRCRAGTVTRAVTTKDRITFNGLVWDITAISPLLTVPAEIEFTGVASRG